MCSIYDIRHSFVLFLQFILSFAVDSSPGGVERSVSALWGWDVHSCSCFLPGIWYINPWRILLILILILIVFLTLYLGGAQIGMMREWERDE